MTSQTCRYLRANTCPAENPASPKESKDNAKQTTPSTLPTFCCGLILGDGCSSSHEQFREVFRLMLNLKLRCFRQQTQLQQVSASFSGVRIHPSSQTTPGADGGCPLPAALQSRGGAEGTQTDFAKVNRAELTLGKFR